MHRYTETSILPYSPAQMFALVTDIEKYPEFLPWCRAARIISHDENSFVGELIIHFGHLTERYTSRVTAVAPADNSREIISDEWRIEVSLVDGPFTHLYNHWRFMPHENGCKIHLDLDFQFKSKLLDKMLGQVFGRACDKMVGAFTNRAQAMYSRC